MRFTTKLSRIGVCVILSTTIAAGQTLSTYGTPGLIDMPTGDTLPDGSIGLTASTAAGMQRNTLGFQILPDLYGAFRYSIIEDFDPGGPQGGNRFDRSFDLHYQITSEGPLRPAIAVGLRDFGGTGVYSGEYLVATKSIGHCLKLTTGLGWGRLGQRDSFDNPLGLVSDRFNNRPDTAATDVNRSGQIDAGAWFRGPAALFAGIDCQATDRLSLQMEYSSDLYTREASVGLIDIENPVNLGASYRFDGGSRLRAYTLGGTEVGLQYSLVFDPARRPNPGGFDRAPVPLVAQQAIARPPVAPGDTQTALQAMLADQGLILKTFAISGPRATIAIENSRWYNEAQAAGRAARVLAAALPAQITTFDITFQTRGMPVSTVTLQRADLETLSTDYDGAWKTLARSRITDAGPSPQAGRIAGAYPVLSYGAGPYTAFSFFDPDAPLRYDLGVQVSAAVRPTPGLTFSGLMRRPLVGNVDQATRRSDSVLPRVRSDAVLYAIGSDVELNRLTAEYLFRPGPDLFGRVSAGYLENMFGGVSSEVLWAPSGSRIALGAELNYARQRDFDMLLGFQDYDIMTGHASAYFDIGNGFTSQIDLGRYLAGDWGGTFSLDREFNNGFRIGGYFTLTDVPFEDFGEGSFDKGLRISMPLAWLTGQPSRNTYTQNIQPVLRDGGARLQVENRLYGLTRDYRASALADGWGRFYR